MELKKIGHRTINANILFQGETVDIDSNLSAIVNTQPVSQEDAAFREWLCSFPEDRKFSPAALRYAAAIFSDAEGHEAVEPLVTLHNSIPLGQVCIAKKYIIYALYTGLQITGGWGDTSPPPIFGLHPPNNFDF